MPTQDVTAESFEVLRWERECDFRSREIEIKELEAKCKQRELAASRWVNPLVVAILAATLAALGNLLTTYWNGEQQRSAEVRAAEIQRKVDIARAEESRVLAMLHATSTDQAAENLAFLIETGLISDEALVGRVKGFLARRPPKTGPQLAGTYDPGFDSFTPDSLKKKFLSNTFRNPSIDTVETIRNGHTP